MVRFCFYIWFVNILKLDMANSTDEDSDDFESEFGISAGDRDVEVVRTLIKTWEKQEEHKAVVAFDTFMQLRDFPPGLLEQYLKPFLGPAFNGFCCDSIIEKVGKYAEKGTEYVQEIHYVLTFERNETGV